MLSRAGVLTLATLALAGCGQAPSEIRATGSSTVFPFTKAVADAFVRGGEGRKAPVIASTGTGAGFQSFCQASGAEDIDLVDASRRMTRGEFDKCRANEMGDIIEVPIGLDGVALAESAQGPKLALTRRDVFLALAAEPTGAANAAKTWRDVNPRLPAVAIKVLGPPATSGTRQSFVDLLLQPGCLEAKPGARSMQTDPKRFEEACGRIRGDGAYVEAGEDDNAIVARLEREPQALGLIGYSYLSGSGGRLQGVAIDGVAPSAQTIASGGYPAMRTLYLYVKKASVERKPELKAFLDQYIATSAPGGELAKRGLIPLSDNVRRRAKEAVDLQLPLDQAKLPWN